MNTFSKQLEQVRISCAGLARIIIDSKYLLLLNKAALKRGNFIYTPIGGGIEFTPDIKDYLDTLVVKYERDVPDLRLFLNKINIEPFKEWFYTRKNRELSISRELIEELVEETNILDSLKVSDFNEKYIKVVEDIEYYNGINNYRYFEVFNITFSEQIVLKLLNYLNKSNMLYLATEQEIDNGKTISGIKIGANSKSLL